MSEDAKKPKKMKNWSKTKEYKALEKDMLDDLEVRGLLGPKYTDKVAEYMSLWCTRKLLEEDIEKRGVYVMYQNGEKQKGVTDNKSILILTRVSAQMQSIWTALGFREPAIGNAPNGGMDGEEDDEL